MTWLDCVSHIRFLQIDWYHSLFNFIWILLCCWLFTLFGICSFGHWSLSVPFLFPSLPLNIIVYMYFCICFCLPCGNTLAAFIWRKKIVVAAFLRTCIRHWTIRRMILYFSIYCQRNYVCFREEKNSNCFRNIYAPLQ